jgi:hypothetical protein
LLTSLQEAEQEAEQEAKQEAKQETNQASAKWTTVYCVAVESTAGVVQGYD